MATKLSGRKTAKLKPCRTPRPWKVSRKILDGTASLAIDSEIQAAPLQSRWQLSDAIAFGRRTLQVAIEDARYSENYRPGEALAYWKRTADLAGRAHRILEELIRHIGPTGVPQTDIVVPMDRAPVTMVKSGKIRVGIGPMGQSPDQAKNDTTALLAALESLAGFADRCQRRRIELALRRKNEGDIGKRAFVYRLAEGWIFLTGKRPGRSYHRSPFLRFVTAAWTDAGFRSDQEDFSKALDATLNGLKLYEGWSWSDRTQQSVSGLAQRGPVWKK
jgi:hypothetical protein